MGKKNVALMVVGLALFGVVAAKVGWGDLLHQLPAIAAALPVLFALDAMRIAMQTSAWRYALRASGIQERTMDLIGARLASRAMAYLSVLGPVVSEPLRIRLLSNRSRTATAATLVDTGVYWASSWFFTIFGTVCALQVAGGRRAWTLLLLAPLVIGAFLLIQKKTLLPVVARRLGERCPSWLREGQNVEASIREFQGSHPACIRRMFWLDLACQVLMCAELAAIFVALGHPCHLSTILGLETASRAAKAMGSWLPARIGADESGLAAASVTLGISSLTGLAVALARRVRDLIEATLGLCWLGWRSRSQRKAHCAAAGLGISQVAKIISHRA